MLNFRISVSLISVFQKYSIYHCPGSTLKTHCFFLVLLYLLFAIWWVGGGGGMSYVDFSEMPVSHAFIAQNTELCRLSSNDF